MMGDSNVTTAEELTKLKLAELRKLCKKHDLLTTGTKLELISRLIDNQGENFTILQPGDEAKLLGDDVDEESIPFNITDAAALDKLDNDADLINIRTTSDPKSSQPSGQPTVIGSKRTVSRLSESSACPVPEKSKAVESTQSNSDISTAKTVISLAPSDQSSAMSETDCLNARAIRFGLQRPAGAGAALTDDKLAARARRFGLPVNENRSTSTTGGIRAVTGPSVDAELLRKRAERFGEVTSPIVDKLTEEERRANRLARFGPVTSPGPSQTITVSSTGTTSDEERKAARALKFGLVSDEDKLLKRKARFGLV
ncbi:hypothetical protein CSKR_107668 [Clonorchis sinensis]|uniref:SAP domain-containing protein n=1 Tax=Clonorchis sinensis TaxID=79923 RepID=A0A8T1LXX0_CLOSI|nr:hypothetical protein CSKR_107668 [Clonorchis sinensis]